MSDQARTAAMAAAAPRRRRKAGEGAAERLAELRDGLRELVEHAKPASPGQVSDARGDGEYGGAGERRGPRPR